MGKTSDGKSTAINVLFNIIKEIELEDEKRLILVKDLKKKGGQSMSQTDGLHLYSIKDNNNNPL